MASQCASCKNLFAFKNFVHFSEKTVNQTAMVV